jgi:hypothetical protein
VDWNLVQRRFAQAVVKRASAILLPAIRDRVDPKRAQDWGETTYMIAVGNLSTHRGWRGEGRVGQQSIFRLGRVGQGIERFNYPLRVRQSAGSRRGSER